MQFQKEYKFSLNIDKNSKFENMLVTNPVFKKHFDLFEIEQSKLNNKSKHSNGWNKQVKVVAKYFKYIRELLQKTVILNINKEEDVEQILNKVVENVRSCYDAEQGKLVALGLDAKTEGVIRTASGNFVEAVLQNIFDTLNKEIPSANIESKVGKQDYLETIIDYKGEIVISDEIQVDRHVYSNGKIISLIENKTYLDACYLKRAYADFQDAAHSLESKNLDPADVKYIVFSGQNAIEDSTLLQKEAHFWNNTKHLTKNPDGFVPVTYFFLKGKRSSTKPLFKVKHELDDKVIKEFTKSMIESIKKTTPSN